VAAVVGPVLLVLMEHLVLLAETVETEPHPHFLAHL
jgi:hypothetical protein